jgi:hypothetical protein
MNKKELEAEIKLLSEETIHIANLMKHPEDVIGLIESVKFRSEKCHIYVRSETSNGVITSFLSCTPYNYDKPGCEKALKLFFQFGSPKLSPAHLMSVELIVGTDQLEKLSDRMQIASEFMNGVEDIFNSKNTEIYAKGKQAQKIVEPWEQEIWDGHRETYSKVVRNVNLPDGTKLVAQLAYKLERIDERGIARAYEDALLHLMIDAQDIARWAENELCQIKENT